MNHFSYQGSSDLQFVMFYPGRLKGLSRYAKSLISGAFIGTGSAMLINGILVSTVLAEEKVEPPKYPWSHLGLADSYDHSR
jgi:hypothetical protein